MFGHKQGTINSSYTDKTDYVHLPNTVVGNRDVSCWSMDSSRPVKLCCGICLCRYQCLQQILSVLLAVSWRFHGSLGCNWGIWGRSQHLKLFWYLSISMNCFCSLSNSSSSAGGPAFAPHVIQWALAAHALLLGHHSSFPGPFYRYWRLQR